MHDLALEAAWAAKYSGLTEQDAIRLASTNVERALGLSTSPDFVVWEGSPLQYGGTPVLSFRRVTAGPGGAAGAGGSADRFEVATCWPDEEDE